MSFQQRRWHLGSQIRSGRQARPAQGALRAATDPEPSSCPPPVSRGASCNGPRPGSRSGSSSRSTQVPSVTVRPSVTSAKTRGHVACGLPTATRTGTPPSRHAPQRFLPRKGNYIRKSHRGFVLISRVIEVANANAPRRADAPIPDAASCLPLQRGGSAGPWPSNSVAEIGKATPRPHARSSCRVSTVSAMPKSNHDIVYNSPRKPSRILPRALVAGKCPPNCVIKAQSIYVKMLNSFRQCLITSAGHGSGSIMRVTGRRANLNARR